MALPPFVNEPFLDFSAEEERRRMREAVASVQGRLGRRYPLRIGAERIAGERTFASRDPAVPDRVVGELAVADRGHVDRAVQAAEAAFASWSRVSPWERAAVLVRAADVLRQRRRELLAWMAFEVGKNFEQGDAELAETIDHFEYNAREILRWAEGRPIQPLASEINLYRYHALGVGVVIAPWNFPAALPFGMVAAAVAAGDAVVLKPSEESSVVAHQIVDALEEAGLPPGVVNVLTGAGAEVGDALVRHPGPRFVAFVGSRAVGTRIYAAAAALAPGQRHLKRIMTEMGGKNAAIVTPAADLDWAVPEIVRAALGYQGQKCSVTSRVIAVGEVHDRLVEALRAEMECYAADRGPAPDNRPFGPVVNEAARRKIEGYIAQADGQGRVLLKGAHDPDLGHFLTPTLVDDVAPEAAIAQEEIFGPFVSVLRARDLEHAVEIANGVEYALTGSVYSQDPRELDYARDHLYVGNLYLNRGSTGAMVGVHPFGGYRMSGTGPKVGGPDYLGFFLEAQAVTQRVRYPRRG